MYRCFKSRVAAVNALGGIRVMKRCGLAVLFGRPDTYLDHRCCSCSLILATRMHLVLRPRRTTLLSQRSIWTKEDTRRRSFFPDWPKVVSDLLLKCALKCFSGNSKPERCACVEYRIHWKYRKIKILALGICGKKNNLLIILKQHEHPI